MAYNSVVGKINNHKAASANLNEDEWNVWHV